ncbi:hypothetical protein HKCCE2091_10640 [Rhodobacterales bacterium HKCCE2091]|nr:hypothetical protein [Rhodobacterales bacterium HKCCE2091]
MPFRTLLFAALLTGVLSTPLAALPAAAAETVAAADLPALRDRDILRALAAHGYAIVSIRDTWPGRTRITATNGFHTREVILSRSTGEVLRDMLVE